MLGLGQAVSTSELLLEVRKPFRVYLVEGFLQCFIQVHQNPLQRLGRSFRKEIMFLFPLRQSVRKAFIVEAVFPGFKAVFLERKRLAPDEPAATCVPAEK